MKTYLFTIILTIPFFCFSQKRTSKTEINTQLILNEKSPATSFLLSAVIPGTGQMYNNQVGKGLTFFILDATLLTASNLIIDEKNQGLKNSLLIAGVTIYLIQLIEAPIATRKLNLKRGFSKISPIIEPTSNSTLKLGLNYNF
jgi:hypothetical protein